MASGRQDFMEAIKEGDVAFLRSYLRNNPGELNEKVAWENYDGFPLNYAAFCNQPEVISLLVTEFGANPNRNQGVGTSWTPLHHAKKTNAAAAAGMLVLLGANPAIANESRETTTDFCNSREVMKYRDPGYLARAKAQQEEVMKARRDGSWSRTGDREITHDYELPDLGCRLKDIFNFETRTLRAVAQSVQGLSQSILFFDDMPDPALLRQAADKLKDLGGDVSDDEIAGGRMLKKLKLP